MQVIKAGQAATSAMSLQHQADILFTFIMKGTLTLQADGKQQMQLHKGDAFVIPPTMNYSYLDHSEDIELLEVSLPG